MTDYNDGKWHGWNGGECPVHPESVVDVVFLNFPSEEGYQADNWKWDHKDPSDCIIAFRVTKPYVEPKEPREWWVCWDDEGRHDSAITEERPDMFDHKPTVRYDNIVHVREVLE